MPALAVADELRARGAEPLFAGARGRAEEQLVPAAGYEISYLAVRGIDRRNPLRAMGAIAQAGAAVGGSARPARPGGRGRGAGRRRLRRRPGGTRRGRAPHAAGADGGRQPPGLANRLLAPFARRVCLAFPIPGRDGERYVVTGRPVPREIVEADRDTARERLGVPPGAPCVLVFGGSLGARSLNLAAVDALRDSDAFVVHITGRRDFAEVQARLGDAPPHYRVLEYLDTLADPLAAGDLVVARAGGSIFEIAAAGRPAILVPYPAATADHQTGNARWMADAGAAVVLPDAELTAGAPARRGASELLGDPKRLEQMSASSRSLARPDAAARIADEVMAAIGGRRRPARRLTAVPAAGWAGRRLHFVGIGGAGMSGLALIANALGARRLRLRPRRDAVLRRAARGGDRAGDRTRRLARRRGTEVVVSTAIPADLPEVEAAERVLHRSELLEQAARLRRVIAVGGTHGKTTTTAMVAHVLSRVRVRAGVGDRRGAAGRRTPGWGRGSGWPSRPMSPTARSCASIPRSPWSRTSSSTTTPRMRSEAEVRAAFGSFLERLSADGTVVMWEGAGARASAGSTGVAVRARPRCRRAGEGHRADGVGHPLRAGP